MKSDMPHYFSYHLWQLYTIGLQIPSLYRSQWFAGTHCTLHLFTYIAIVQAIYIALTQHSLFLYLDRP